MILKFFLLWYICTITQNIYAAADLLDKRNITNFGDYNRDNRSLKTCSKPKESVVTYNGITNIVPVESDSFKISSKLNISNTSEAECPGLEDADNLSQTQLINRLTAPCRYDRLERPTVLLENGDAAPVDVYARIFIYVMQSLDSNALQLKINGLLQLRYVDSRLAFGEYTSTRNQPLLGEAQLRNLIWVPHIFFSNEHDSSVLGTEEKDILTSISADGTVMISSRIKATLYCWMDLRKFPFDEQYCSTQMESWTYNATELLLHWERNIPTKLEPNLQLTEYSFVNAWYNETIINGDESDMRHGVFSGNYSALFFTVHLLRKSGDYVLDYFIPSVIIVAISWVSFWLQADQTSPRTTLETTTMLSFITLSLSQDNNLPKVSYIKISEIWFLSCILFIFGSLVEFAFVNTIWRRKRKVALKKVNSKHILKSTLVPRESHYSDLSRSASSTNSLDIVSENANGNAGVESDAPQTWAMMTPQDVSMWIDRKARFLFPLAFLLFNLIFWVVVYCA